MGDCNTMFKDTLGTTRHEATHYAKELERETGSLKEPDIF
jgi:hypothetical protein